MVIECIGFDWVGTCSLTHFLFSCRYDDDGFFARPVTLEEAPDYFDIIKHPMDFGTMRQKIDGHIYNNMEEFKVIVV